MKASVRVMHHGPNHVSPSSTPLSHTIPNVHIFGSERRDADKRMYERLRQPRNLCREYALEDGRRSRQAAAALAKKNKYADARERMEDARRCFVWAGGAEEELRQLTSVGCDLEVRCSACFFGLLDVIVQRVLTVTFPISDCTVGWCVGYESHKGAHFLLSSVPVKEMH